MDGLNEKTSPLVHNAQKHSFPDIQSFSDPRLASAIPQETASLRKIFGISQAPGPNGDVINKSSLRIL